MKHSEFRKIRSKLLTDFEFFTRYFFRAHHGRKFDVAEHHKVLFKKGEEVARGDIKKLILNIAPRYSKTEIMVKMFISWSLANNPKARFIHLSYSDSLALDNSEEIKNLIESDLYQYFFPWVKISKSSRAKNKWYTTENGGVLARSSSGQVTGFGAGQVDFEGELIEFGGAIVIDDPIKPDDANSDAIRESVNTKFDTTIRNRVNSRNTPIIIIMQRLHPQDLCGYLLDKEDDWTVVRMPAIKENGEALWPEKHTIEELREMERNLGSIFLTQYMQDPEPIEGYLIPIKEINLLPNNYTEDFIKRFVFIDPSEKGGDMMSAIFVETAMWNGRINFHIFDVVHSDRGFDFLSEVIHSKAVKYKVDEIIFEKNGVGLATGVKLKGLNVDNTYKLRPYHETENKEAKILNQYEFILRYFSFNSEYRKSQEFTKYISHLTTYQKNGKNSTHRKDAIDVASMASKILKVIYSSYFKINS